LLAATLAMVQLVVAGAALLRLVDFQLPQMVETAEQVLLHIIQLTFHLGFQLVLSVLAV
jgi:hypothetical protein